MVNDTYLFKPTNGLKYLYFKKHKNEYKCFRFQYDKPIKLKYSSIEYIDPLDVIIMRYKNNPKYKFLLNFIKIIFDKNFTMKNKCTKYPFKYEYDGIKYIWRKDDDKYYKLKYDWTYPITEERIKELKLINYTHHFMYDAIYNIFTIDDEAYYINMSRIYHNCDKYVEYWINMSHIYHNCDKMNEIKIDTFEENINISFNYLVSNDKIDPIRFTVPENNEKSLVRVETTKDLLHM